MSTEQGSAKTWKKEETGTGARCGRDGQSRPAHVVLGGPDPLPARPRRPRRNSGALGLTPPAAAMPVAAVAVPEAMAPGQAARARRGPWRGTPQRQQWRRHGTPPAPTPMLLAAVAKAPGTARAVAAAATTAAGRLRPGLGT